jgi:amino acid transporter
MLGVVVVASLFGGEADGGRLTPLVGAGGVYGVLQAGGIIFFAFAGYARIATLGEEVRDPERVRPRRSRAGARATVRCTRRRSMPSLRSLRSSQ